MRVRSATFLSFTALGLVCAAVAFLGGAAALANTRMQSGQGDFVSTLSADYAADLVSHQLPPLRMDVIEEARLDAEALRAAPIADPRADTGELGPTTAPVASPRVPDSSASGPEVAPEFVADNGVDNPEPEISEVPPTGVSEEAAGVRPESGVVSGDAPDDTGPSGSPNQGDPGGDANAGEPGDPSGGANAGEPGDPSGGANAGEPGDPSGGANAGEPGDPSGGANAGEPGDPGDPGGGATPGGPGDLGGGAKAAQNGAGN